MTEQKSSWKIKLDAFLALSSSFSIWLLLRLFRIEVALAEVKDQQYVKPNQKPAFTEAKDESTFLAIAKDLYTMQEDRYKLLFEKSKNLLTVSTLLVGLLAAIPIQHLDIWLRLIPLAFVVLTVILVLIFFSIGRAQVPTIKAEQLEMESMANSVAIDYWESAYENSYFVDYRADVYRAAIRSFALAMLSLLVVTGVAAISSPTPKGDKSLQDTMTVRSKPEHLTAPAVSSKPNVPIVKPQSDSLKAMPKVESLSVNPIKD